MGASTTTNNSCCRSPASKPCAPLFAFRPPWRAGAGCFNPADIRSCRLPRTVVHAMHSHSHRECNMGKYLVDILAVGFFILEWTVYAITLEHTAYGRDSLSARMHAYRETWIRRLLDREARMVDMQIMASLQNGTAFFASTSLLAIGGALALLRSTSEALGVLGALP